MTTDEQRHCKLPVQEVIILVSLDEYSEEYFRACVMKYIRTGTSKATKWPG